MPSPHVEAESRHQHRRDPVSTAGKTRSPRPPRIATVLAVGISLACSACGTTSDVVTSDPFLGEAVSEFDAADTEPPAAVVDGSSPPSPAAVVEATSPPEKMTSPPEDVSARRDVEDVRTASLDDAAKPVDSPVPTDDPQVGRALATSSRRGVAEAISFTQAEPRQPGVACPPGFWGGAGDWGGAVCPPGAGHDAPATWGGPVPTPYVTGPEHFPDEYLCDGGDRALPVHYDAFNRQGLDTEDAVAEWVDDTGERHVKPTNRVCLYAPRFGAVRTVDSPGEEEIVTELATSAHRAIGAGMRARVATVEHEQQAAGVTARVRSRASGFDLEAAIGAVDHTGRAVSHTKLINLHEAIRFLRTGILEEAERPVIARAIQAAAAWSRDQTPVATAQVIGAQEVDVRVQARQHVGVEDDLQKPGVLRVVKLADKADARPGEIVTFTIRYDNVGDRPLHHVRIVDNLTPRLEYVEDSATSDRAGRLVVQDNDEGSLVLVFEVGETIAGHTGGVVTFRARVQ